MNCLFLAIKIEVDASLAKVETARLESVTAIATADGYIASLGPSYAKSNALLEMAQASNSNAGQQNEVGEFYV